MSKAANTIVLELSPTCTNADDSVALTLNVAKGTFSSLGLTINNGKFPYDNDFVKSVH